LIVRESLELWVAWRHLRSRESRRWTRPTAIIFAYVTAVGVGFMIWARIRGGIAEEIAAGPMVDLFIPPVADIAGLIGLATLALGLLGLTFALLAALFNLLSAIIILSVAQGCMALVVVLSLMTGLEQDLQAKIIKQKAEVRVTQIQDEPFVDYEAITAALRELDEVASASPYAQGEVMLRSPYNRQGGLLVGIQPDTHAEVSNLEEQIDAGAYRFLTSPEDGPWEQLDRLQKAREEESQRALAAQLAKADARADELGSGGDEFAESGEEASGGEGELDDPDGEGWEDPAVEVPKLRGETGAPTPAPTESSDHADLADATTTTRRPELDTGDDDWDKGWEDPEVEIPKLRAAGDIPAARVPSFAVPLPDVGVDQPPAGEGGQLATPPTPSARPEREDPAAAANLVPLLMGAELTEELAVPLGGRIQLITPIGRMTPSGQIPSFLAVRVVGIFYSGMYAYDRQNVYAPLDRVQALLRLGDTAHGIEVKLVDPDSLDAATTAIRARLDALGRDDLRVESWRSLNRNLFSAMFLEKIAMFIGLLFVVLVAAFGILATNLMSVLDKAQEIAILKAMGASDRRISRVFMIEGMVVGVVGSLLGIAAGILFCSLLTGQGLPLPSENFYTQRLPVVVSPLEVLVVGVAALAIVWLSSVHPARTAARLRPLDGLRSSE